MTPQARGWRRAEALAVVEVDGRVVALDLLRLREPPVVLVDTAAEVWRAIDGDRDEGAIVAVLADRFGMAVEQIRDDVHTFVEELADRGLVVWTGNRYE